MTDISLLLLFLALLLAVSSLLQPVAQRFKLPHSVLLALLGLAVGVAAILAHRLTTTNAALESWRHLIASFSVRSDTILGIFLPILLFGAGLTLDVRRLMDDLVPILVLAVVAVAVCTLAVGLTLAAATSFGIAACLLLGAIVATTDPVAVIGVFRDLGAPKRLAILVEGESLFNDAAAIILFSIVVDAFVFSEGSVSLGGLALFPWHLAGGLLAGAVSGSIATAGLRLTRDLPLASATLTVVLAYAAYVVTERYVAASGVVAVVVAALVIGNTGRVRLSAETWRHLSEIWAQLGFWAASLIFVLGAMLMPRFLSDARLTDILVIGLTAVAAFAARALVLGGLLPLLARFGLGQPLARPYKLALLWGGLRGAVTLTLALAVWENPLVPEPVQRFVAIGATGFVLFTLLINGVSLRPVMRLLGLDRLGPIDATIRDRAIVMALGTVVDRIEDIADSQHLSAQTRGAVLDPYQERVEQRQGGHLSDIEELGVGLVTVSNREEELYFQFLADRVASQRAIIPLVAHAGRLRDAARQGGAGRYEDAARWTISLGTALRLAHWLHLRLAWHGPLAARLADRFEVLMVERIVLRSLDGFVLTKVAPLCGPKATAEIRTLLSGRRDQAGRDLEALSLQYPDYAQALETSFLRRAAHRMEESAYRHLLEESLISQEVFDDLSKQSHMAGPSHRPRLDLGLDAKVLIARVPLFAGLNAAQIADLANRLRPLFTVPGQGLIHKGDKAVAMYFIASGAVEVALPADPVRLGVGDFFGEIALVANTTRNTDVSAISYGQLLSLSRRDFGRFLKDHPEIRRQIRAVAAERRRQG